MFQRNSIIAFQQFDKTSGDFLANYMGNGDGASTPEPPIPAGCDCREGAV
jgi:hypothetical protein